VTNSESTHCSEARSQLEPVGKAAAYLGAPLFLLGTALHPARDGPGVAAAGEIYGVTHAIQSIGLLLVAISLASTLAPAQVTYGRAGRWAWYGALAGTMTWFGLLVFDGSHNPVTARFTPDLVHTPADIDTGGALIVFPALLLFPLGNALLALLRPRRTPTVLLGVGAVVYTIGGLLLFVLGPASPLIQIFEVCGAVPYALGCVLLARSVWQRP
jgi:hypothetical protein